jgi:hypothetical protein
MRGDTRKAKREIWERVQELVPYRNLGEQHYEKFQELLDAVATLYVYGILDLDECADLMYRVQDELR